MAVGFKPTVADSLLNAAGNATSYTGPANIFIKLHTGDPGAAGTSNAAGNTSRQEVTFGTSSGGTMLNDNTITWTSVSTSETYSRASFWDASTSGNFLFSGTITANAVTAGDTFTVAVGGVSVTLSVAA